MPQLAQQPEFDFEHSLPPGREYFTLRFLAGLLRAVGVKVPAWWTPLPFDYYPRFRLPMKEAA